MPKSSHTKNPTNALTQAAARLDTRRHNLNNTKPTTMQPLKRAVCKSPKKTRKFVIPAFSIIHETIRNASLTYTANKAKKQIAEDLGISPQQLDKYLGLCQRVYSILTFNNLFSKTIDEIKGEIGEDVYNQPLIPPKIRLDTCHFLFIYNTIRNAKNISQAAGQLGVYKKGLNMYLGKYRFNGVPLSYSFLWGLEPKDLLDKMGSIENLILPEVIIDLYKSSFEEIHGIIIKSKNEAEAAGYLAISMEMLKKYFKHANTSYNEFKTKDFSVLAEIYGPKHRPVGSTTYFEITSLRQEIALPLVPPTQEEVDYPVINLLLAEATTLFSGIDAPFERIEEIAALFPQTDISLEEMDLTYEKTAYPIVTSPLSATIDNKQTFSTAENPYGFYYYSPPSPELSHIYATEDVFPLSSESL